VVSEVNAVKFGIAGTIQDDTIRKAVYTILEQFERAGIEYVIESNLSKSLGVAESGISAGDMHSNADIVLAFGGDGTLLSIARELGFSSVPILGINAGHLGFLTDITIDELLPHIDDLQNNRFYIEKRIMLEADVEGIQEQTFLAVNDFFIDKGEYPRIIKIALSIENEYCVTYTSDGIVVATATGSTAYSLSAGGPIVYPTVDELIVTPICPHTLSARPMIIPGNFTIILELRSHHIEVPLNADGYQAAMLRPGQKVTIRKSKAAFQLVHFPSHNFFNVLSTKLGWGARNDTNLP
jgi:NAD+ kinase